jgi:hypothetical protein
LAIFWKLSSTLEEGNRIAKLTLIYLILIYFNSITVDGVSAFDFLNNVYYYVTDGNSDFVFRGNVNTKTLMSPIAFPFEYIFE